MSIKNLLLKKELTFSMITDYTQVPKRGYFNTYFRNKDLEDEFRFSNENKKPGEKWVKIFKLASFLISDLLAFFALNPLTLIIPMIISLL